MASATLGDAAMAATQEANDEPVPSALSHMVRKPVMMPAPSEVLSAAAPAPHLARVEGQRHGGHEEAGLAVEVVVDQGRVDPGLARPRHAGWPRRSPSRRRPAWRRRRSRPGCRRCRAGRPAAALTRRRSSKRPVTGYSPTGNSVVKLISDEYTPETPASRRVRERPDGDHEPRADRRLVLRPPAGRAGAVGHRHHRRHRAGPGGRYRLQEQVHRGQHAVAAGGRTSCRRASRRKSGDTADIVFHTATPIADNGPRSTRSWRACGRCPTWRA